jgi:tetratricopeptide (TPR) repeat protein
MTFSRTLSALILSVAGLSAAAQMPGMDMQHHHHDDATETLGHVHFPISCAPASQAPFERGIALLHSFGYTEAEEQFRDLVKADPACAMAHWGVAMSQFHELWGRPNGAAIKTGAEEMKVAGDLAAKTPPTPRELAYIHTLDTFYTEAPAGYQHAADDYVSAMASLHAAYPDDVEGAAYYALALLADVAPDDTSLTKERKALAVLIPLFHDHPDHPGLAHYIIHTCDTPALAPDGLEAAKVYARIAPSSAHATHMPGHIFARLGLWQEDIASNEASVRASEKSEAEHQPGVAHQLHADEFLVYAYLQVGEDEKARALTANIRAIGQHIDAMPGMDDMKGESPYFDNELAAIYPMEMHDWKTLAAIQPAPKSTWFESFDTYWGQGVAAGHLRDKKLGTNALKAFDKNMVQLKKSPYAYQAANMQVQRNEIVAWRAFAANQPDAALAAMRAAADQQDKLGQGEVDIPAREMLGDLLVELHRPQEALAEYKVALKLSPNRLNGLLSAGEAAEAANRPAEAAGFYAEAAQITGNGKDTARPLVAHAVQFASAHPTVAAR